MDESALSTWRPERRASDERRASACDGVHQQHGHRLPGKEFYVPKMVGNKQTGHFVPGGQFGSERGVTFFSAYGNGHGMRGPVSLRALEVLLKKVPEFGSLDQFHHVLK